MDNENKKIGENISHKSFFKSEIFMWVKEIVIALAIVLFITTFIGQLTKVVGISMMPNFEDGDRVIIEKISKRFGNINRYDVIVFPHGEDLYIKRIIALSGESVEIKDGKVFVDGKEIDGKYEFEIIQQYGNNLPIVVPDGEYFVLGDNRNHSNDSRNRDVGTIKGKDITGKAVFRVWPLNKIGTME